MTMLSFLHVTGWLVWGLSTVACPTTIVGLLWLYVAFIKMRTTTFYFSDHIGEGVKGGEREEFWGGGSGISVDH